VAKIGAVNETIGETLTGKLNGAIVVVYFLLQ